MTFENNHLPYSVYIAGERQNKRVYQFRSKPIICIQCQAYGHTQKWWKNKVCRRCAAVGHDITQCAAYSCKCYHCSEKHEAGSKVYAKQEKEKMLIKIQDEEKCHIMRETDIAEEKGLHRTSGKQFTTHFHCKMAENNKRQFTPRLLEKCLQEIVGNNLKSNRSNQKLCLR